MKVAQLCLILCNPMDCIIHGILQARILEWVAYPFSSGSSLLQWIFLTQGSNQGLLHCRWILYQLSYREPSSSDNPSNVNAIFAQYFGSGLFLCTHI